MTEEGGRTIGGGQQRDGRASSFALRLLSARPRGKRGLWGPRSGDAKAGGKRGANSGTGALMARIAEAAEATIAGDQVDQIAMLAGGGIGLMCNCNIRPNMLRRRLCCASAIGRFPPDD